MIDTSFSSSSSTSSSLNIDQKNFMSEVVDASQEKPVLVDFWAPWCGPCRQLTPVLEKAVSTTEGRIKLTKLDVEANRTLASQLEQMGLPLQSIPLVVSFWKGQVQDLFQGLQSPKKIKEFIKKTLETSGQSLPTTELLKTADTALKENNIPEALENYAHVLENEEENTRGWSGLIRCLLAMDDLEGAEEAASQVPNTLVQHHDILQALSALSLHKEGKEAATKLDTLHAEAQKQPDNIDLQIALAIALNGANQRDEAAHTLLTIIAQQHTENALRAKNELLRFFDTWGITAPETLKARRQLSSLLFS